MDARPYDRLAEAVSSAGPTKDRMRRVVDVLWAGLEPSGVSWVGFYVADPSAPEGEQLVLGPCRDKPACSPIGLHGVCGQALRFRRVRVVSDVTELGEDYIACDPRDRAEIVIPLLDEHSRPWAVLDVDSHDIGAFDEQDAHGLASVLRAAGFLPSEDV